MAIDLSAIYVLAIYPLRAVLEENLDFLADTRINVLGLNVAARLNEHLVEIGLETKPVLVLVPNEVVAR